MSKVHYSNLLLALPLVIGSGTAYATTTLNPASTAVTVTYTLPNISGAPVTDLFEPTNAATFIYVSGATPAWLNVTQSATGGPTALTAASIVFQANAVAATMEPGTYTGSVTFATTATGYSPATVTIAVTLAVKAPPATFGVTAGSNGNLSWYSGQAYPTLPITCTSSGEEIAFSVTLGGNIASSMTASVNSGIAYEWGTTVTVSFSPQLFLSSPPGTSMTGTVTLTPNNGTPPVVINVNINVTAPGISITSLSPTELPKDTVLDHTMVINGTGFISGVTLVKVGINGVYATLDAAHAVIANATSIVVTLDHNTYLSTTHLTGGTNAAGPLTVKVQNGASGTPTSASSFYVTTAPIVYAVTNSASYAELPGTNTVAQVAPYELISIFGANFDAGNGMVVNSANSLGVYPATMNNSHGDAVTVGFYSGGHSTLLSADVNGTLEGLAPMIFVSNTQINCLVPSAIAALITSGTSALDAANILVTVNSVANDLVVPVDVYDSTPGIFTPSGTGQGVGAIINATGALNSASTPAVHATIVTVYASGLGAPTATGVGDINSIATRAYPASCVALGSSGYLGILAGTIDPPTAAYGTTAAGSPATGSSSSYLSIDGAVIASADLFANLYPPCFTAANVTITLQNGSNPAVTIPTGSIAYAGFVADSIAGLYQINFTLPATFTPALAANGTPLALSIAVNGVTSQSGVIIYVQ